MTIDFDLPPLDAPTPPAFDTAAKARQWAQNQTLTNPAQIQADLLKQLDLLNRTALPVAERIDILDALKKLFTFVQEESAKRYVGKPLPLLLGEQNAYDGVCALRAAVIAGEGRSRSGGRVDSSLTAEFVARSDVSKAVERGDRHFLKDLVDDPPRWLRRADHSPALDFLKSFADEHK